VPVNTFKTFNCGPRSPDFSLFTHNQPLKRGGNLIRTYDLLIYKPRTVSSKFRNLVMAQGVLISSSCLLATSPRGLEPIWHCHSNSLDAPDTKNNESICNIREIPITYIKCTQICPPEVSSPLHKNPRRTPQLGMIRSYAPSNPRHSKLTTLSITAAPGRISGCLRSVRTSPRDIPLLGGRVSTKSWDLMLSNVYRRLAVYLASNPTSDYSSRTPSTVPRW